MRESRGRGEQQAVQPTLRSVAAPGGSAAWQSGRATPGSRPLSRLLLAIVFLLGLSCRAFRSEEPGAARAQPSAPDRTLAPDPPESEELPEAEIRSAVSAICPQRFTVSASGLPLKLAYCTDAGRSLDTREEAVTRAVVVVHGSNRNADDYHAHASAAAAAVGASSSTIVVAPQILEQEDIAGCAGLDPFVKLGIGTIDGARRARRGTPSPVASVTEPRALPWHTRIDAILASG